MAERRHLVEGLKSPAPPVDAKQEADFVYGRKSPASPPSAPAKPANSPAPQSRSRQTKAQLSIKMRSDFAEALKRASLERELAGVEPFTQQDILEQALEPWLRENGYLS